MCVLPRYQRNEVGLSHQGTFRSGMLWGEEPSSKFVGRSYPLLQDICLVVGCGLSPVLKALLFLFSSVSTSGMRSVHRDHVSVGVSPVAAYSASHGDS